MIGGLFAGRVGSLLRQHIGHNDSDYLPPTGLLFYARYPNAVLDFNWDEELDWDQQLLGYSLPETDAVRAATGWVNGTANFWFEADGGAITRSAAAILKWDGINYVNIWFTAAKGLAVYSLGISDSVIFRIMGYYRLRMADIPYPSAFFNSLNLGLAIYTGGPTYVPDPLGAFRSPGANRAACEGFPLATAVEDGAVLGPELITVEDNRTFASDTGFWSKGAWVISGGVASYDGAANAVNLARSGLVSAGKLYKLKFTVISGRVNLLSAFFSVGANTYVAGDYDIYIQSSNWLAFSSVQGYPTIIDNISIKEVIPTYLTTDESGDPILPSTPQKTVTYSSDWLSKTFAETFSKFDTSDPLKAPGWLCEPVRTNYALNSATPATHTTGTIAAGTYTLWQDGTGSIAATAGTAVGTFGTASNGTPATITITTAGTVVLTVSGSNDWVQLEGGAFKTSRIYTTTAPMVRAATIASFPTEGKIPVNNFAIRMIVVPRASGQVGYLFDSYIDDNNSTSIILNSADVSTRKRIAGTNADALVSLTHGNGVPIDLLIVSTAANGMQISARTYSGSWGTLTDGAINSTEGAKADAQIAATYQLGSLNGSSQFTGNISSFDCVPIPLGTTDPMAWAKAHWGVA